MKDTDITVKMPKKFQYRWTGPFKIVDRDGDHYNIDKNGKRVLVNPGRLRPYFHWAEEPWEGDEDEDEENSRYLDEGEPKVGDMVIVALLPEPGFERPFAVGEIIEITNSAEYILHWYGNRDFKIEGTYRPEWRRSHNRRPRSYYSETPERPTDEAFTSRTAQMRLLRKQIKHFGFKLTYNDRLPKEVLLKIKANKTIKWPRG